MRLQDAFKIHRLEWVLGFPQLVNKKTYREEKYKYGIEFVDRINDDAYTYMSTLIPGPNEESLFSQLYKCKNKFDTNCIQCLKELLHLMAEDDDIARFVFNTAPPTYQNARFTDWMLPYLENQKNDTEKSGSVNSYFKHKYDSVRAALEHYDKYQSKAERFQREQQQQFEDFKQQHPQQYEELS